MFFDYYKKNLIYPDAKPNKAHIALAELETEGKLTGIVTQNIDGLHQKAGSRSVYELHGSVLRNRCMECGHSYDLEYIINEDNCENGVPKCEKCGGIVKPDVVLYEEPLDNDVVMHAVEAISEADTLIVVKNFRIILSIESADKNGGKGWNKQQWSWIFSAFRSMTDQELEQQCF